MPRTPIQRSSNAFIFVHCYRDIEYKANMTLYKTNLMQLRYRNAHDAMPRTPIQRSSNAFIFVHCYRDIEYEANMTLYTTNLMQLCYRNARDVDCTSYKTCIHFCVNVS